MAERYIRRCDHVLIVAPISRIETNPFIHVKLKEVQRSHGSHKTLVCTKIDEIGDMSLEDVKEKQDRERLVKIKTAIGSVEEELRSL